MTEPSPAQPNTAKGMTPLLLFSLFLSFCEVTAGYAAVTLTGGWIQAMFAIFAIGFPVVVFAVFFLILWRRPVILYGPADYPENVDVTAFTQAITNSVNGTIELAGATVATSVSAVADRLSLTPSDAEELAAQVRTAAEDSMRARVTKVDISIFARPDTTLDLVITEASTVADLLDSVYATIHGHVARYTYGVSWVLRVKGDGRRLTDIGTNWAMNNNLGPADTRRLGEIGVTGGMELVVDKV